METGGTVGSDPTRGTDAERGDDVFLRFESVTVMGFDDKPALSSVSFDVGAGETRVILGEAGSGKTVLLKVAAGLIRADEGRVTLFGQDITNADERELFDLRANIGILFQEGGLFDSLTIEENVSYPLLNQRSRKVADYAQVDNAVREALRFVELEHTLNRFPSELSGGMRRRVGIARAVVTEPKLVLYDSPTAGLDPITANTIMALIVKERDIRGTAAIMATHRYQDGQLMANFRYNPHSGELQRVSANGDGASGSTTLFMVMKEGRLVFEGTQPELESSQDPYLSKFVLKR
jgi:phospholipid/cholesterol/gamma-HCH transport system ATP-binding protein